MTSYAIPDLTGQHPFYAEVNVPVYQFMVGQKIIFKNSPIYASSLRIVTTDGTSTTLVKTVDWEVQPSDIDQHATSQLNLEKPGATDVLVQSVTLISSTHLNSSLALNFQQFYLTVPQGLFDDGTPLEVTPELIKSMISDIGNLKQQYSNVTSPVAPTDAPPKLLPLDINKSRPSNFITGEVVTVNTVSGAKVIALRQGGFFADSLVLSYQGNLLNKNTDYLPIGLISALTKGSTNKGGIYQFILLNGTYAGDITINYHAVGGEVRPADFQSAFNLMTAIKTYLNGTIMVTPESIAQTPAFKALHARQTITEDNVRRLLTGNPTYGEVVTNDTVVRPIVTADSNFHWYTVAKLYQVQGSTDTVKADQFKGRVYFPGARIALAFTLDANLDQTRNIASFRTDSFVFDPNYILYKDLSASAPVFPMVRLVYNQISQGYAGAYIQIGLPLTSLSDKMVVENFSSPESCWLLDHTNEFQPNTTNTATSGPSDNGFALPDGASLWSSASSVSLQKIWVPTYKEGYLAYVGSGVTLNQLATNSSTSGLFNIILPNYFPVDNIDTLIVSVMSADGQTPYEIQIPMTATQTNSKLGRTAFVGSANDALVMRAVITKNVTNVVSVFLNIANAANGSTSLTDVVRYIRVRV